MIMRRRRVEWFGDVKRRDENIRAVVEMKVEGKHPIEEDRSCGGKTLSERTWKPGTSGRNEKDGKVFARPATLHRETPAKGGKLHCFTYSPESPSAHQRWRSSDGSLLLPVRILWFAGCLLRDGALEDLPSINLLLHAATCDQTVHNDVLLLSDTEGSVDGLRVSRWVPARIIWEKDI